MIRLSFTLLGMATMALGQSKFVYLTFDDGPQRGSAEVLDVLAAERVPATFFLTGSNALNVGGIEPQRQLVKRMMEEGHDLGNHGYIHKPMTKADYRATYGNLSTDRQRTAFRVNYQRNVDHFRKVLDQPTFALPWARLPGDGSTFSHLVAETDRLGYQHFHWQNEFAPNGDFRWLKHYNWHGADGVAADYADLPADGAVLLLHDRHWAGEKRHLLRNLITTLKAKGYQFAKLSQWRPKGKRTGLPAEAPDAPLASPVMPATPPRPAQIPTPH